MKRLSCAVAATAALALAGSIALAAGPPQVGTGTGSAAVIAIESTTVTPDGDTILVGTTLGEFEGLLEGVSVVRFRWVIHPDGSNDLRATGTFSGRLGSCGVHEVTVGTSLHGQFVSASDLVFFGSANTTGADPARYTITLEGAGTALGLPFAYTGHVLCRGERLG